MIDASMIPDFIVEAREHLDEVESSLLKLESDGESLETLNEIFRAMHTIKGAAQFVGIVRVGELSHKLENLLDLIRQGERDIDYHIINTLIEGKDRISLLVEEVEKYKEEKSDISDLLTRIHDHEKTPEAGGRLPEKKSILKEPAPAEMPIDDVAADDEIELTENFKELFSSVDEVLDDYFADDTTVIDTLSGEQPDISPAEEDVAFAVTEQEPLKPDSTDVDIVGLDEKLESLFAEEEAPPPAPQQTEIDTGALKKEIESEDFDEELFQIFIQQLQENISLLRALTDEFTGASNKSHVVGQCSDLVSKLHSSANYMGYDRLSGFYGQWIAELEMVDLELSLGSQVSFDFMNANMAKIAEIFPQIADSAVEETLSHETLKEITPSPPIPPSAEKDKPVETTVKEEEKPEDFKELFSSIDEISEDTTVLDALSGGRPDISSGYEDDTSVLTEQETLRPDIADVDIAGLDEKLESLFDEEEQSPSPASDQKDVAGKPARKPPQTEIDTGALKEEIESEDFDEELFQIFIQQLQENISLLRALTNKFTGASNKTHVVGQCSDLVSKLHSSANYMGYDRLTGFYGQWIAELEMVDLELSLGSQVSFDFMNANMAKIAEIFPQITDSAVEETLSHETLKEITPSLPIPPSAKKDKPVETTVKEEEKPEDKAAEHKEVPVTESFDIEDEIEHIEASLADDESQTSVEDIAASDSDFEQAVSTLPDDKVVDDSVVDSLADAIEHFTEDFTVEESAVPDTALPFDVDEVAIETDDFEKAIESFPETDSRRTKLLEKLSGELESLSGESDEPAPEEAEGNLLALLQDEIKHEDYDRDLFEIYANHIHEGIVFLSSLVNDFAESNNKLEVLKQCTDIIQDLRLSSNYMDYEHFTQFYLLWGDSIRGSEEELSKGHTVTLDYMAKNIDLLTRVFPKIPKIEFAKPVKKDVAPAREDVEEIPQAAEPEAQVEELQLFDKLSDALEKEDEKHLQDRLSGALEADEDQQLFNKLSSALETSTIKQKPTALKPIDDVINEILSGEGLAQPSSPTAPVSSLQKRISTQITSAESPKHEIGLIKETALKTDLRQEDTDRRIHITDRRRGLEDRRLGDSAEAPTIKQSIRVDADKIDFLMNQVGELVVNKSYISQLSNEMVEMEQYFKDIGHLDNEKLKPLKEYIFKLNQANVALGRVSSEIQDGVMNVRMLPVGQLFKRYPRLVRDLVYQSGKKVELMITGEDTELDKMVIEEVSAPLIHIIRNAVDHGIETVEERRQAGKEETAVLRLEAYPDSSNIVIEITDDGRGIDPQIIKAKALEKNLFAAEELDLMSDQDLVRLIMIPGFTTVEHATSTSGRGVGMDVVKTNIEKLNGSVDIESVVGHETLIRVKIPITMAIIQALSVKVGSRTLTIPLTSVVETARVRKNDISTVEGVELVDHRDVPLPVLRLAEILNIDTEEVEGDHLYIVIVSAEGQRAGLVVDKFIGKEEAVIKPLAEYLRRESGFSGATIKGDGTISLIIDIPTLIDIVKERQVTQHKKQVLNRSLKGLAIA